MFLRTPESEPMTCSRPLLGPNNPDPGLYGPGDGPYKPPVTKPDPKHPGCRVSNGQMIEDDGKASSDTATRNPNNLPVYSYSPSLAKAFPTNGCPPMPYLNDFSALGR
jgi:hypothetical protein